MKRDEILQRQRQRLARWLSGWEMTLRLDALAETPDALGPESAPKNYPLAKVRTRVTKSWRVDDPLRLSVGDIVLLPPETETTRSRPVYVALIEAVGNGKWLVMPFGRFFEPAIPGELATGREAPPLRVLCLWNAGEVDDRRLARGWLVGRLTARELRWVQRLPDLPEGEQPPLALALRLGPPLHHPLDPRHDYLEQERMLWLETAESARDGEASTHYDLTREETLPLAAEKRADYEV